MNSRILKIVSLFLTIVLLVNMLPLNVLAEDISSNESVAITSEPQIVDEIVAKRTKYTKEYLLDNGLFVAAVYNEPVHFQKDGQWKEIDNTLVAKTNGTYTNTAGVWEVQFPQKLSQSNAVSITKDGYTVSFAMAGELRNQGNLEIASMEDSLSTSSAPLETASITVGETVETFSVSSAQLSTAQLSGQAISSADWTRSEVSYTNNGTSAVSITARVASSGTGTTYVDCTQLENAPTASRYNLMQNSDFQASAGWSSGAARVTVAGDPAAPNLNNTGYRLVGNMVDPKNVSQKVTVSGQAGDTFVFGGWGKADSVPTPTAKSGEKQRVFAIMGTFTYTDGTTEKFYAKFNPDTDSSTSWQFASQVMVAKKDYSSIAVSMNYSYNANTAYFDGVQLFKEEFGNSYTYDDEGNVISVTDLQKQTTSYEYDDNNNLTKIIQDNKAKMTYDYDEYRNVTVATSEEGLTYNFGYDAWGNNTSVSIIGEGKPITSYADWCLLFANQCHSRLKRITP